MTVRKEFAPEVIARARELYEQTDTPSRLIAAEMGICRGTFDNRVAEWGWTRRRYTKTPPAALPIVAADRALDARPAAVIQPPRDLIEHVQRVTGCELDAIEQTLKVLGPANSAEAERSARVLAMLSSTVQGIWARIQGQTRPDEADDDPVPVNIDEFRATVALRMRALIDARQDQTNQSDDATPPADESGGA